MDALKFIFGQPILLGFAMGLIVALVVWWGAWRRRRALTKELTRLQDYTRTQIELTGRGQKELLEENKKLKEQTENLRISLASLSQKTDKAELRRLRVYDKAIREICVTMPGFNAVWDAALKRADAEVEKTRHGILPFLKEIVYPSFDSLAERQAAPRPEAASNAEPEPAPQPVAVELLPEPSPAPNAPDADANTNDVNAEEDTSN